MFERALFDSACILPCGGCKREEKPVGFRASCGHSDNEPVLITCLDLEGVLVPEIWINVAERSGIDELRVTTRDIPDYDDLMRHRLAVIERHDIRIQDIQAVIKDLAPLEGAREFIDWLRARYQVIVLSDTFYQFAEPLMRQLGWPTLFCHDLVLDDDGHIVDYRLRQADQKRQAVQAIRELNFKTIAVGDSYNDTSMLAEADRGILFRPPQAVVQEFPQYPITHSHEELKEAVAAAAQQLGD